MKTYKVSLTRVYQVNIRAKNGDQAKELVEFYIGDPNDQSTVSERKNDTFKIIDIEMMLNEATEILE